MTPLLEVTNLSVTFDTATGPSTVIDDLSFTLDAGASLAVLGESGSGKSVTAKAIMGLLPPAARVTGGSISLDGEDLGRVGEKRLRALRGSTMAMVFQDAMTSLNPVVPVGDQIGEMFRIHEGTSARAARRRAIEMMDAVRIPDAARRVGDYPFQFSGGMRQRVMIAMAIALRPRLLIADEPTTALDVTVQAQILDLLAELQSEHDMALMLITHDIGVAAEVAERGVVMYAGRLAEQAPIDALLDDPRHPYTLGLVESIPQPGSGRTLYTIPGSPPNPQARPTGCSFHPRCRFATDVCRELDPAAAPAGPNHLSACHHWEEVSLRDHTTAGAH